MATRTDAELGTPDGADLNGSTQGFTDAHCHCLPGLDDGPVDMPEALSLCRALVDDGVTRVVASPHQLGRFDGRCDASVVRQAVAELNRMLREHGIMLTVLPGADIRLDERIPQLLESDKLLTMADSGRYLLLELPHEIFIDPLIVLERLHALGLVAVITHPERHGFPFDCISHAGESHGCAILSAKRDEFTPQGALPRPHQW